MDLQKLNEIDLGDIDFKRIGAAPAVIKLILIAIVCIILGAIFVFAHTNSQIEELEKHEKKELTLRDTFDKKQAKAANLDAYVQQLEEMQKSFGALLRQLPNKTEIESLLTDISQTGIASGLEIELFKPEGLSPKDFYAEYPIKLRVTGHYHEFGKFVSGVAALPRIVTLRNITISKPKKESELLQMEVTAVTYQYMEGDV